MDVLVRPVRGADSQSIVELLNPIIEAGGFTVLDELISANEQEEFIRTLPEWAAFNVAVASQDGSVVGIQNIVPIFPRIRAFRHVCEIATYVSLNARRQGVGAALFQEILESARGSGFAKIVATIRADNPDALAFYESHGFHVVGVSRQHALVRGRLVDEIQAEMLLS